ncbi:MAG: flagellar hook-length control protein FliK [Melioribacteraceae bacterium]|nr:MAG: flagellar hook-length control protein FliK [Melioribacteraceae bacterium]
MIFNPLFIDSDTKQINPVGFGKTNSTYLFKDIINVAKNFSAERSFNSTSILSNILSDIKGLINSPGDAGIKLDNKLNLLLNELNISSAVNQIGLDDISNALFKESSIISGSPKEVTELITEALKKLEEEFKLEIVLPKDLPGETEQDLSNESNLSAHIASLLLSDKPLTFHILQNNSENLLTLSVDKVPQESIGMKSGKFNETLYSLTLTQSKSIELQESSLEKFISKINAKEENPDIRPTDNSKPTVDNKLIKNKDTQQNNNSKIIESLQTSEKDSPGKNIDQKINLVQEKPLTQSENQNPSHKGIDLSTVKELEKNSLNKGINSTEVEQKKVFDSAIKSEAANSKTTNQKAETNTKINDDASTKSENQTKITKNDSPIVRNEEASMKINLNGESTQVNNQKDLRVDSKPLSTIEGDIKSENDVKIENLPLHNTNKLNDNDGKLVSSHSVNNDVTKLNSTKHQLEANSEISYKNDISEDSNLGNDVFTKRINSAQKHETNNEIIIKLEPKQEKQIDEFNNNVRKNFVENIEKIITVNKTNFVKIDESILDNKEELTLKLNQVINSDNRFADTKKEPKNNTKAIDQISDIFKKVEQRLEKINLSSQSNAQSNTFSEHETLTGKIRASKPEEVAGINIDESDMRLKIDTPQKDADSPANENSGKESKIVDSDSRDKNVSKNNTAPTDTQSTKLDNPVSLSQSNRQVISENQPNNFNEAVHVRTKEIFQPELNKKLLNEISDMAISDKKDKAIINLAPAKLGKIRIALEIIDNKLNARLEVESQAAKEMLTNQVDFLKESLNSNGLQLNTINISLQNSDQKNNKAAREKRKDTNVEKLESKDKGSKENKTKTLGYNTYEFIA